MSKILFIHCYRCGPTMTWYPIVRQKLEAAGHSVIMPQLPGKDKPQAQAWLSQLKGLLPADTSDLHIAAHSLGTRAALLLLEETGISIPSLLLIGALANSIEDHQSHPTINSFFKRRIDTGNIQQQVAKITLLHGRDDDRVPFTAGQSLAAELGAELIQIDGYKHFLGEDAAEPLLKVIQSQLK